MVTTPSTHGAPRVGSTRCGTAVVAGRLERAAERRGRQRFDRRIDRRQQLAGALAARAIAASRDSPEAVSFASSGS